MRNRWPKADASPDISDSLSLPGLNRIAGSGIVAANPSRSRLALDPRAVVDCLDRCAPQGIGRLALESDRRFDLSNLSSNPGGSIKKRVDLQTTAASELQVPLVESVGLMVSPCVTEIRTGRGSGPIHGLAECDVSWSS